MKDEVKRTRFTLRKTGKGNDRKSMTTKRVRLELKKLLKKEL